MCLQEVYYLSAYGIIFGTSGCLHTSEPIIDNINGCKRMFAEWTQRLYLRVFLEEHRDEFSITAKRILYKNTNILLKILHIQIILECSISARP